MNTSILSSGCTIIMVRLRWSLNVDDECKLIPVEPDWFKTMASMEPSLNPRIVSMFCAAPAFLAVSVGCGPE